MEVVEFKSELKNLNKVQQFIEDLSDAYNINDSYFGNILLAITEAVRNAIIHGNMNEINKSVKIGFWEEKNELNFIISDEGNGFNYDKLPDALENENTGRGLFLMHSLADKVEFFDKGSSIQLNFILQGINTEVAKKRMMQLRKYTKERIKRTSL